MGFVDPGQWPARRQMALRRLARGAIDAPWPQASWFSVLRRGLVVAGLLLLAVFTDRLDTAVFAAFGALQVGLGETVLPFRALVRQLAATLVVIVVVSYAAMSVGGTWLTVPLLAAVAFLQGTTSAVGPIPRAAGIGALALAVIFSGIRADPAVAVTWLAIGAIVQSLIAIACRRRERVLAIRVVLANLLRTADRIVGSPQPSGLDSNAASEEIDEARATIRASGAPNRQAALRVADSVNDLRRNLIAWRELERPGLSERMRVSGRVRACIGRLSDRPGPHAVVAAAEPQTWPVGRHLDSTLDAVDAAIGDLSDVDPPGQPVPETSQWRGWAGWRPGSAEFTHGVRMALAISVAQVLALTLPLDHAFWIPLTCVFVVKPDWSFTLVRSAARIGGNVLAVLLVPAVVFLLGGSDVAVAGAVLVISGVAFRYFTGNYIIGSFGIAGTILVLDDLLSNDPALFVARVIATVIGAMVGIAAVAVLPSWRSGQAVALVDDVVRGLSAWSRAVLRAVQGGEDAGDRGLQDLAEQERVNLIRLRPAVQAAILEPRPAADPRCLAVIVDAAERAHLCLMVLTYEATMRRAGGWRGLDVSESALAVDSAFAAAMRLVGEASDGDVFAPGKDLATPVTGQEVAVMMTMVRLQQAAVDLRGAVAWLKSGAARVTREPFGSD